MPETKTFKNEPSGFANGQPIIGWRMSTGDVFSSHEWDMEVTFTRKPSPPPKFKAGDRVNTIGDELEDDYGTVVAGSMPGKVHVVWDINPLVVQTHWDENGLYLV